MPPILRPSFTQPLDMTVDEAMSRIDAVKEIGGAPVIVEAAGKGRHRMIALDPSIRHTWSPWAHLDLREPDEAHGDDPDAQSIAVLRFSPNPALWFAIMFSYLTLATIAFFALCWGGAQMIMHNPPWALWVIPVTLAIALAIVVAARIGQRLAHEQMLQMRGALRAALGVEDHAGRE